MRNFGGILLILGVLGFFYASGQKDKHPALPEGLTVSETMRYPGGRWEMARYGAAGGLYICILTNPTMGGVAASWALQGYLTLAEPGATIGFAGRRTIQNTIRLELPEGFQTSEFLFKHGFVDRIVHRRDLRTEVARLIDYCQIG